MVAQSWLRISGSRSHPPACRNSTTQHDRSGLRSHDHTLTLGAWLCLACTHGHTSNSDYPFLSSWRVCASFLERYILGSPSTSVRRISCYRNGSAAWGPNHRSARGVCPLDEQRPLPWSLDLAGSRGISQLVGMVADAVHRSNTHCDTDRSGTRHRDHARGGDCPC